MVQRLGEIVDKVEVVLSRLLLVLIVLLVFFSSLLRYLGYPINGADTVAAALFVWLIYIGSDLVLRQDRHLGVDYLTQRLPIRLRKIVMLIVHFIVLAFLAAITHVGVVLTIANNGRILGDLPVSYAYVAMAVPVGAALMCLTTVTKIVTLICNFGRVD
ncbi:TRAP transporter small permease [Sporolituus thermophilus]|uniref:TRAP-type C4-dicarboxylate transport system, small permease component n=1 Tax=Sporolituus thermophilus DSM 23256 TaxID=1123285 RepID=A0A1G7K9N7_9FIRM|nr:TRAP transporter small permease [Sporolituus thermophilus]SDF33760.1 TRAP-type C4-dicarboxylate transport system, small permease component [Sporolituus thermophilus DSM 23256]